MAQGERSQVQVLPRVILSSSEKEHSPSRPYGETVATLVSRTSVLGRVGSNPTMGTKLAGIAELVYAPVLRTGICWFESNCQHRVEIEVRILY